MLKQYIYQDSAKIAPTANGAMSYVIDPRARWIGVDFDGVLAEFDIWHGIEHTGKPIQPTIDRVRQWLKEGELVYIFTARVDDVLQYIHDHSALVDVNQELARKVRVDQTSRSILQKWSVEHIGQVLPITNTKDPWCKAIWDDIAVQMIANTGQAVIREDQAEYLTDHAGQPGKMLE